MGNKAIQDIRTLMDEHDRKCRDAAQLNAYLLNFPEKWRPLIKYDILSSTCSVRIVFPQINRREILLRLRRFVDETF